MWIVWLSWDLLLPAAIPDFIRDHPGWRYLFVELVDNGCHGAYGGGGAVAEGVFFQEFLDVVQ